MHQLVLRKSLTLKLPHMEKIHTLMRLQRRSLLFSFYCRQWCCPKNDEAECQKKYSRFWHNSFSILWVLMVIVQFLPIITRATLLLLNSNSYMDIYRPNALYTYMGVRISMEYCASYEQSIIVCALDGVSSLRKNIESLHGY